MKNIINLLIGLISFPIVMWTLTIPQTVNNQEEMQAVRFGYPLPFIVQSLRYDPPSFPKKYHVGSPRENPFRIILPNFIISYFTVFIALFLIVKGLEKESNKVKKPRK